MNELYEKSEGWFQVQLVGGTMEELYIRTIKNDF